MFPTFRTLIDHLFIFVSQSLPLFSSTICCQSDQMSVFVHVVPRHVELTSSRLVLLLFPNATISIMFLRGRPFPSNLLMWLFQFNMSVSGMLSLGVGPTYLKASSCMTWRLYDMALSGLASYQRPHSSSRLSFCSIGLLHFNGIQIVCLQYWLSRSAYSVAHPFPKLRRIYILWLISFIPLQLLHFDITGLLCIGIPLSTCPIV